MKIHSTNYFNTLVEIAEDSPVAIAEVPPLKKDKKSVANLQFEMVNKHPYQYTSDDVFFSVYAEKQGLTVGELEKARAEFFSKGQPCFRASPLTKRYGWGVHSNENGKVALVAVGSDEYEKFQADSSVAKTKAMRFKRA
ncbi:hypothetical protein SAMN06298216_1304 [Spirosomataceae bacterium TFI 002]|nr:hypothetical protein SAMN06298216_1304 [Spirosomataceae bacterium TFI 002]